MSRSAAILSGGTRLAALSGRRDAERPASFRQVSIDEDRQTRYEVCVVKDATEIRADPVACT
jgi:hypothetical protein